MNAGFDVIVVGAGPAGSAAATELCRHGLNVAVIDENAAAGGQIYRAPSFAVTPAALKVNPDLFVGEHLRSTLASSGANLFFGHKVWLCAPGVEVRTVKGVTPYEFHAKAMVIATGTTERVVPIPGSTLPGVIGLAGATVLLKAHGCVPASPTVVAGVGPLLYAVAAGILKSGGQVAMVVDLVRPAQWLETLPQLVRRPELLRRGISWMSLLRSHHVPVRFGHTVTRIHGDTGVRAVTIEAVDRNLRRAGSQASITVEATSVAMGHGLVPATEISKIMGVAHTYEPARGGWVPVVHGDRSTNVDNIYIAGDCTGISGAAAANMSGTLAGLSAARDLGAISAEGYARAVAGVRRKLYGAEMFGAAMSSLMMLRPEVVKQIADETIVCRCEDVTKAAIDTAIRRGAIDANQLKSTTRCGMGPCQGRMCGDVVGEIIAGASGRSRNEVGHWTTRIPLRVVPMEALIGEYTFDQIPRQPVNKRK